uniref:Uncharacterized protein n=1 Tax=Arundo donax TaxID=35708 RepID=A0A0A9PBX8_ARUDO
MCRCSTMSGRNLPFIRAQDYCRLDRDIKHCSQTHEVS